MNMRYKLSIYFLEGLDIKAEEAVKKFSWRIYLRYQNFRQPRYFYNQTRSFYPHLRILNKKILNRNK